VSPHSQPSTNRGLEDPFSKPLWNDPATHPPRATRPSEPAPDSQPRDQLRGRSLILTELRCIFPPTFRTPHARQPVQSFGTSRLAPGSVLFASRSAYCTVLNAQRCPSTSHWLRRALGCSAPGVVEPLRVAARITLAASMANDCRGAQTNAGINGVNVSNGGRVDARNTIDNSHNKRSIVNQYYYIYIGKEYSREKALQLAHHNSTLLPVYLPDAASLVRYHQAFADGTQSRTS
jgi:hypothetical protein